MFKEYAQVGQHTDGRRVCAICPLGATAYEYKSATVLSPAPIFAKNGMVSSNHPIATLVGLNTLQRGGNAFDAAVATALALTAVDMAMVWPRRWEFLAAVGRGKLHAVDAGTQAPAAPRRTSSRTGLSCFPVSRQSAFRGT